ncbi:Zn-dependent protease with chaperone function [Glycomyces harbinensis]|uniref:Zn-dependent protease with chaperone function n=2 Tax=Glycomyces harbinensis TaxID=58114 RepID=A0A1G7AC66_9ACTN|nr:Zn-dependent protease with chaperone function [Glycomyces harbinensis]
MLLIGAVPTAMFVVMSALIWFNVYAFTVSPLSALKIAIGVVPSAVVLGSGLWVLVFKGDSPLHGVPVREEEQPELWALVRRLAEAAGTAPPDDIRLTADANAAVVEDTRLLGLIALRRHMFVGAPLVAEMAAPHLAAVIAHELAHYGNRDTRFAGTAYRSRSAFAHTLTAMNRDDYLQRGLHFLLRHYGRLVLHASANLSRRQERAADEAAARTVGSAPTVAAFGDLTSIAASWELFRRRHLVTGWQAGYLPADAFAGFRRLRDSLEGEPVEADEPDPYDTHPPMGERIASVRALDAPGTVRVPAGAALGLLRDPRPLLDAALLDGLGPEALAKRRADWPALVRIGALASATEHTGLVLANAARATGRPVALRTLLDALDADMLVEVGTDPAGPQRPTDGPRVRRERARILVHAGLTGAVLAALTDAGALHWSESWPSRGAVRLDERYDDSLPDLLDAAVSDRPDTTRLRALLDSADQPRERPRGRWHYR